MSLPKVAALLLLWPLVTNGVYIPPSRRLLDAETDSLKFESGRDLVHPCIQCPAGTHQSKGCDTLGAKATCTPCRDGVEYTEFPNDMPHCLSCTRCKSGQEEASRCSTTRNTECRCKEGTFCPPDHPCEACVRCRTSCPEGEAFISPCNATSDAQCAKPTDPPATDDNQVLQWVLPLLALLALVALAAFVVFCVCRKRIRKPSTGRRSGSPFGSFTGAVQMLKQCRHNSLTQETRDNYTNNSRDPAEERMLPLAESNGGPTPGLAINHLQRRGQATDNEHLNGTNRVLYNLTPVNGNQTQALQDAFYVFASQVPKSKWSFFVRKLDLTNPDIEITENDYKSNGTLEIRFQMLRKWHERTGNSGSVNTLLQALHDLELEHISKDISGKLQEKNTYKLQQAS